MLSKAGIGKVTGNSQLQDYMEPRKRTLKETAALEHPTKMRMLSQVGAGEVTGNPLFQAFDEAIRGCALGETAVLEAKGGKWMPDLYFEVCLSFLDDTSIAQQNAELTGSTCMLVPMMNCDAIPPCTHKLWVSGGLCA